MYKPPQIYPRPPTQTGNAKNPLLNHPSKYRPPRGLVLWKLPSNTKKNKSKAVNLLPTRLAQSILKCKFPSVNKPLRIQAPQKGPLENISPGAYFRNFTVTLISFSLKNVWVLLGEKWSWSLLGLKGLSSWITFFCGNMEVVLILRFSIQCSNLWLELQ